MRECECFACEFSSQRSYIREGIPAGSIHLQRNEGAEKTGSKVRPQRGIQVLTVEGAYARNRSTETVPLNARVLEALRNLREGSRGEFVFTNRRGQRLKSVRTSFTTACRHANLSGVTPRCLRHTFAPRLGDAGVSDGTIQALGRWKEAKMIRRCRHLTNTHLREAVDKIGFEITPVITPAPGGKDRKCLCARSSVG